MHGQRASATRVDEPGGASNPTTPPAARAPLLKRGGEIQPPRPPRPLRGRPSSREEGKSNHPDHPARCAGAPPQERRGNPTTPTTPPAPRAPLLKRGGEIQPPRPPRPLRGRPSSREEGKSNHPDHPARCAGAPPQERRGNQESPSAAFCLAMSSAIPRFASASRASICAVEKGSPSAVPWISTKPPDPVITTFMSVSQPESST